MHNLASFESHAAHLKHRPARHQLAPPGSGGGTGAAARLGGDLPATAPESP